MVTHPANNQAQHKVT